MGIRTVGIVGLSAMVVLAPVAASAAQPPNPFAQAAVPVPDSQVTAAVGQIPGLAHSLMQQTGVPGLAVAVVYKDKLIYSHGFGVRSTATDKPITPQTVFQLASVSKPLAAAAIAGAVGRHKLKWTTPIQKELPWFKLSQGWPSSHVTVEDMLSHRSGLPGAAGDSLETIGYSRKQILKRLSLPPLGPFRAQYAYSDFGYTAAGEAAAKAVGISWPKMMQRYVFGPLGMNSSSATHKGFLSESNRASLHVPAGPGQPWQPLYQRNANAQSPAGGASSNVLDLAKWMRLEMHEGTFEGRRVIAKQALQDTDTGVIHNFPQTTTAQRGQYYGLGINVSTDWSGRVTLTHSGAFTQGAATSFIMVPGLDLGIVALTNGLPVGVPESLTASFVNLAETGRLQTDWLAVLTPIFKGIISNPSKLAGRKPPKHPKPAGSLSSYVGTYGNSFYGPGKITRKGKHLFFVLGPDRLRMKMTHWTGREFAYYLPGEGTPQIAAINFTKSKRAFTVENLETDLNTFRR